MAACGLGGGCCEGLSCSPGHTRGGRPSLAPQLLLRNRQTAVDARTVDGTTALMLAAKLAVEDLVEDLIAAQADVGARDKWGMDLGVLVRHREVEQWGCEVKMEKGRGAAEEQLGVRVPWRPLGVSVRPPSRPSAGLARWSTSSPFNKAHARTVHLDGEGGRGRGLPVPRTRTMPHCPVRARDVTRQRFRPEGPGLGPDSPSPKARTPGKRAPAPAPPRGDGRPRRSQGKPLCTGPPLSTTRGPPARSSRPEPIKTRRTAGLGRAEGPPQKRGAEGGEAGAPQPEGPGRGWPPLTSPPPPPRRSRRRCSWPPAKGRRRWPSCCWRAGRRERCGTRRAWRPATSPGSATTGTCWRCCRGRGPRTRVTKPRRAERAPARVRGPPPEAGGGAGAGPCRAAGRCRWEQPRVGAAQVCKAALCPWTWRRTGPGPTLRAEAWRKGLEEARLAATRRFPRARVGRGRAPPQRQEDPGSRPRLAGRVIGCPWDPAAPPPTRGARLLAFLARRARVWARYRGSPSPPSNTLQRRRRRPKAGRWWQVGLQKGTR